MIARTCEARDRDPGFMRDVVAASAFAIVHALTAAPAK